MAAFYYEILELMDGLARRGDIVGLDLVEVAPDYDPTGSTDTGTIVAQYYRPCLASSWLIRN